MTVGWPLVSLAEVLDLRIDPVPVDPSASYRIAGVYSFGRGLLARGPLSGSETTYKTLHRLHEGDFVLSQLKAWEGALSKVSQAFDGWFLSPQFPTLRPVEGKLDITYLDWYCKQPRVWELLRSGARGMGARRDSVSPRVLLSQLVPLPPLEEQRRIVARIEELSAKIEEARSLRRQARDYTETLVRSEMRRVFRAKAEAREVPLERVCSDIIDNLHSNPVYADRGIPCVRSPDVGWGRLKLDTALRTSEEEYIRRTSRGEPRVDDIVLVREGGGTGKAAVVEEGQRFSLGQRVVLLRPDRKVVLPRFLLHQMLSPAIYEDQVLSFAKGSASPHLEYRGVAEVQVLSPVSL